MTVPAPQAGLPLREAAAAVGERGGVQVFWSSYAGDLPRGAEVTFWSGLLNQSGWSHPQRAAAGTDMAPSVSLALTSNHHAYAAAVPLRPGLMGPRLMLAHQQAGSDWETRWVPLASSPAYLRLAALAPTRLALVLVGGAAAPGRPDRNSVLVSHSVDAGATWEPLSVLHQSGRGEAHYPHLLAADESTLYLAWSQTLEGRRRPDSLLAARSRDGGRTWQRIAGLGLAMTPFGTVPAVMDRAGTLHVVARLDAGNRLVHAWLVADSWLADTLPFATPLKHTFSSIPPDTLLLTWGVAADSSADGEFGLMFSKLLPCPSRLHR